MTKYKVNKFKSKYKIDNKSSAEYLKFVIHKLGCNLLTYSEEVMKLSALNLLKKAKTAPALSDIDNIGNITVFYNDELPLSVQRLALAHELGHIVLGHLYLETIEDKEEKEADKFANYLLAPKNNKKFTSVQITCLILCVCFSAVSLYKTYTNGTANETNLYTNSAVVISNTAPGNYIKASTDTTCYYARYSEVYHLYIDCYYLKNSKNIYTNTIENCHLDRLCSACERRKNKEY